MSKPDQQTMMRIIDEAVDVWHEVADEHDIKHCNCFREKFASRMIELGLFNGYAPDGRRPKEESERGLQ